MDELDELMGPPPPLRAAWQPPGGPPGAVDALLPQVHPQAAQLPQPPPPPHPPHPLHLQLPTQPPPAHQPARGSSVASAVRHLRKPRGFGVTNLGSHVASGEEPRKQRGFRG